MICHLKLLLNDEHKLRRLSACNEASQLRSMFAAGQILILHLQDLNRTEVALRSLVKSIIFRTDQLEVILLPSALGMDAGGDLQWFIPLPKRLPFREAKIRIDNEHQLQAADRQLVALLADASEVQRLVLASPGLSMNQIAKAAGRCRTQLTRLLRISWLSPKIVEAIANGTQPKTLDRKALFAADLPVDWTEQERLFGF